MLWDGTTTIHNSWGSAPTQIFPLTISIELKIAADSIRIFPLDNYGKENPDNYKTFFPSSSNLFSIQFDQNITKTIWFGIEKLGDGDITDAGKSS